MPLLDKDLLALLETAASLMKRKTGSDHSSGSRKGVLRGGDEEFADYRRYEPGDDLRRLDIRHWLRSEELLIKLFARSTAGDARILLDTSASMGTPKRKGERARKIAAALSYLALCASDRLKLSFLGAVVAEAGPYDSKQAFFEVMRLLEERGFTGKGDLSAGITATVGKSPGRFEAVIITDPWDDSGWMKLAAPLIARGCSVSAVLILDTEDYSPETSGLTDFSDTETGEELHGIAGEAAIERYRQLFSERLDTIIREASASRVTLFPIRVEDNLRECISALLKG